MQTIPACALCIVAGFVAGALASAYASPQATPIVADLTHHDAGRTQHATATVESAMYAYNTATGVTTLYLVYRSDDLFCSAFGGAQ